MRKLISTLAVLTVVNLMLAPLAFAKSVDAETPKLIGLYFYASWCSACKELEPDLQDAVASLNKDPFLLAKMDVSNKRTQYQSGLLASALRLDELYEETGIKTGFVLLVDPETGEIVDRLTKELDSKEIVAKVREHTSA